MSRFDFESMLHRAVERLDEQDREAMADVVRHISRGLEEQARHLRRTLNSEVEARHADLFRIANDAVDRIEDISAQRMKAVNADIETMRTRVDRLASAISILEHSLDPVWGKLPRNLYLGIAALLGLVAGAALIVQLASTKRADLQSDLSRLEARKAELVANLATFEREAGFRLARDGRRVVIALDDGFRIERQVSVRGALLPGLSNAWRIVHE